MRVTATIENIELEGDYGRVDSVQATCNRCGHTTESFGTGEGSVNRCLALLSEGCPRGQKNFYIEGWESPPPRPTTESLPPACAEAGEPHGAAGALGRWIDAKRAKYGPDWWRLPEHDAGAVAWANARYGKSKESKAVPWTERDIKLVEVCIRLQREAPADHARLCPNCLRPEYLARKSQS